MKRSIILLFIFSLLFTGCKSSNLDTNTTENTTTNEQTNSNDIEINDPTFVDGTPEEIATQLFNTLIKADYKAVLNNFNYDSTVKSHIDENVLKSAGNQIADMAGEFSEISSTDIAEQGDNKVVSIIGKFTISSIKFNVSFNKDTVIIGFNFVPYNDNTSDTNIPSDITEIPVEFGMDEFILPGILTAPKGVDSYPVLILVHGSGGNDKDETIGPNKPFKDIAHGLASKGIGVLRYEKRTKEHATKLSSVEDFTVYDETIDDVVYAYNYILNSNDINADGIYILGHSLGGYLMPRIAKELPDANGYVFLAGNARPLEDLIEEQIPYLVNLDGTVSKEEQQQVDHYNDVVNNIRSINPLKEYTLQELGGAGKSYWLNLKEYNPISLAKDITKPMLFLQGNRDYQVTLEDFNLWKSGLEANEDVTFKLYEGLNHLFIKGEGVPSPEEYYIPSKLDNLVIDDIAKWIIQ